MNKQKLSRKDTLPLNPLPCNSPLIQKKICFSYPAVFGSVKSTTTYSTLKNKNKPYRKSNPHLNYKKTYKYRTIKPYSDIGTQAIYKWTHVLLS